MVRFQVCSGWNMVSGREVSNSSSLRQMRSAAAMPFLYILTVFLKPGSVVLSWLSETLILGDNLPSSSIAASL